MISFSPNLSWSNLLCLFKSNSLDKKKLRSLFCKTDKEKLFFFSRSSWAIYSIAILKTNPCIFLPDYYCDEAIFLLKRSNIKIIFYKTNTDNSFDIEDLKNKTKLNKPDIIIYCNFFGKNHFKSYLYDLKKNYKAWLVEDATHCLRPDNETGTKGDFVIFSPYKFLPIPMGSIMKCNPEILENVHFNKDYNFFINKISNSKQNIPQKNVNILYICTWIIKQLLKRIGFGRLKIQSFDYDYYIKSEKELFNPNLDFFSKKLMISLLANSQKVLNKRQQMFGLIKRLIEQKKILFSQNLIIRNEVNFNHPYMMEIEGSILELNNFYDYLKKSGLPVLTWPTLPLEIKKKNESALHKRLSRFFIPLHYQPINFIKNLLKARINKNNIRFAEINEGEWTNIYNNCEKKNIVNSLSYINSQKKIFKLNNIKYKVLVDEKLVGIFSLMIKKILFLKYVRINRGPLFLNKNFDINIKLDIINKIISLKNRYSFSLFKFSPEIDNLNHDLFINYNQKSFLFDGDGWKSSLLDLNDDIFKIHKNLNQKWRNSLNLFSKQKVIISEETSESSIEKILRYYKKIQKQKNFKGININFLKHFLNNSNKFIYFAHLESEFIGYICISVDSNCSTYLLGYASETGRKINAMNGLIWHAIKDLKNKNYSYFDLGGLDDLSTPGVYKFKSGVNAKKYKLIGNFKVTNLL